MMDEHLLELTETEINDLYDILCLMNIKDIKVTGLNKSYKKIMAKVKQKVLPELYA